MPAPESLCHVSLIAIVVQVFLFGICVGNFGSEVIVVARKTASRRFERKSKKILLSGMWEAYSIMAASNNASKGSSDQM